VINTSLNKMVFISYSKDSPFHSKRVLDFADKLREEGIDVSLDQYIRSPPEGWPKWMENQIENADFILVICTKTYLEKMQSNDNKGKGVKWESLLTYQDIYDNNSLNSRFIPVLFNDSSFDVIPKALRGVTHYRIEDDYDALYGHLTDQASVIKPPLGKIREISPKNEGRSRKSPTTEVVKKIECPICQGKGRESSLSLSFCPVCGGKGKNKITCPDDTKLVTCGLCRGRGRETALSLNLCPVCGGIGKNVVSESAEKCNVCNGTGKENTFSLYLCPRCDGFGYVDD
jgi:RecJ-like exonuclease